MWFDSSSIANLAKNALKEGRKIQKLQLIAWLIVNFLKISTKAYRQRIGH